MSVLHAGLVALRLRGGWVGALVAGPSGVGKSDLALRGADFGLRLVADDRTLVWTSGASLFGRAPDTLADLLEVRGQGVLPTLALPFCEVRLWAACLGPGEEVERMPFEDATQEVMGVRLPRLQLKANEASAPARLRLALQGCKPRPAGAERPPTAGL